MKRFIVLFVLSIAACGKRELIVEQRVAITHAPPVVAGSTSGLAVPTSCPVYAPGGGDVDTPEPPFPPGFTIICGVDDAGQSYGIADGDAPTAQLAVLPGNHELGIYLGFEASAQFVPDNLVLDGANPAILAFAAATNVMSHTDCCPEGHPDAQRQLTAVALGDYGVLLSFGSFDTSPLQVSFGMNTQTLFAAPAAQNTGGAAERFYVNGPP